MSLEQSWVDEKFSEIVEANYFQKDILVPILADNSLVRQTLMNLPFLDDRVDPEDSKSELEKFLMTWYGLHVELCEKVFTLCEDRLRSHEQCKTWGESNG